MTNLTFPVRVAEVVPVARDVVMIELRATNGQALPAFTAGSHIDLHLPGQLVRSYSLLNDPSEVGRYRIAVHRTLESRGGSAYVHSSLRAGMTLEIAGPRNHFALDETASYSMLVAGGIGITPLYAMLQRLDALDRRWMLYYCARSRAHAAFADALAGFGDKIHFHFDDEHGGQPLDLAAVVDAAPVDSHLYCCGPPGMLAVFEAATAKVASGRVHVEYFQAQTDALASGNHYTVKLSRSGHEFNVAPGETILDKLIELGVDVEYSCGEGICGACETVVLEGQPEHRDLVLGDAERLASHSMMVCCSGCRNGCLVLDL